jgi:hypothetical protein
MLRIHEPPLDASENAFREFIPGRKDNMYKALPPIMEQLSARRRQQGRVGHFRSRDPLTDMTAEEAGSIPMPMPSTAVLYPNAMPAHLYNPAPRQLYREEWALREAPMLTKGDGSYITVFDRLHQDRGNYTQPVRIHSIGEEEVMPKSTSTQPVRVRPVPTDRNTLENHLSFHESLHRAGVTVDGFEVNPRERLGADQANEIGFRPATRAVSDGAGVGSDPRPSLRFNVDVSGNAFHTRQGNVITGPVDWTTRDPYKPTVSVSGNATKTNWSPLQTTPDGLTHNRPTNKTIFGVGFGPDLREDQAADRHQRVRTQTYDMRPELKSGSQMSEVWEAHLPRVGFEKHESRGQQTRPTIRATPECSGFNDLGRALDSLNGEASLHPEGRHFYARFHARE